MPLALDVLFPLPLPPFRYLVPFDRRPGPLGARVAVPWQGGVRIGLVVGVQEVPSGKAGEYRQVIEWLDDSPFLTEAAPQLLLELAKASGSPAGTVLAHLVPTGLREELLHEIRLVEGAESLALPADEWVAGERLGPAELDLYRKQGLLHERVLIAPRTVTRLLAVRSADAELEGRARANQREALRRLEEQEGADSAAALARDADVPESAVRALVKKGYAEYREVEAPPAPLTAPQPSPEPLEARGGPLPDSSVALLTGGLRRDRLSAVLPTLRRELESGRSPLVLAPEGYFLAEAASLLAASLPVLVLSGDSSDEQRERIWEEVRYAGPLVLVGTYGALLAPLRRPGAIVVTEAGSPSYKMPAGPRLFIPTAARLLAGLDSRQLVLADVFANPEMRAWAGLAEEGTAEVPAVELPQVRQRLFVSDLSQTSGWPVGSELARVLRQVEERERQAILLAPRRGFSAALTCGDCGHTVMCPNCDLALRYHRSRERLRCHQCGFEKAPPEVCPECGGQAFLPGRAAGTEWVAGAVSRLVPGLPVLRLDRDHQDDLTSLRSGAPGVLVATSSVFRIPPLPRVSLIGFTLLDTHLNTSDFRAAEESLRLLMQLPELAPHSRPLVVIQTYQPEHPVLGALASDDPDSAVEGYLQLLLERRRGFEYPPFGLLAKIQVSARERGAAEREANRLAGSLRTSGASDAEVLGPVPAPVARVRGQYTFLVYLRGQQEARFRELLEVATGGSPGSRIRVDVDPRDVAEFLE